MLLETSWCLPRAIWKALSAGNAELVADCVRVELAPGRIAGGGRRRDHFKSRWTSSSCTRPSPAHTFNGSPNTTDPNLVMAAFPHGMSPSGALRDLEIQRVFHRTRAFRRAHRARKSSHARLGAVALTASPALRERLAPCLRAARTVRPGDIPNDLRRQRMRSTSIAISAMLQR
jgi:hypothetical protein